MEIGEGDRGSMQDRSLGRDAAVINLFGPLLSELLDDADAPCVPFRKPNLLTDLVEVTRDLEDICDRFSGRPLNASQMKLLANIELLSGSLSAKAADFVALFKE
jgi:hypothetical protein